MKYLLSDGSLTTSQQEYILDTFVTRVKLYDNEIPHSNNNGLAKTYDGIESDVLTDMLQYNILNIASSISKSLKITGVNFTSEGYNVSVKINNQNYELSIGH